MAPAMNPRIVVAVMVDEPSKASTERATLRRRCCAGRTADAARTMARRRTCRAASPTRSSVRSCAPRRRSSSVSRAAAVGRCRRRLARGVTRDGPGVGQPPRAPGDAFLRRPGRRTTRAASHGTRCPPPRPVSSRPTASRARPRRRRRAAGAGCGSLAASPARWRARSRPSVAAARRPGGDRDQRQDLDRLVARAGPLSQLGRRCAVVGITLGAGVRLALGSTGPDDARRGGVAQNAFPLRRRRLRRVRDRGLFDRSCRAAPAGTAIAVALFTNLRSIILTTTARWTPTGGQGADSFDWPGLRSAVVNLDDERGAALCAAARRPRDRPVDRLDPAGGTRRRQRGRLPTAAWRSMSWKKAARRRQCARADRQFNVGEPARCRRRAACRSPTRPRRCGARVVDAGPDRGAGRMGRARPASSGDGPRPVVVDYAHTRRA